MQTLPQEGSDIILHFRRLFSKNVMGLQGEKRFHKYHRVLSQARWSLLKAAHILLRLVVQRFGSASGPLVFGLDETIERRRGDHIKAKGVYRDPVRSSQSHFVKCGGLRWICLMLLCRVPWAERVWALPFLTALVYLIARGTGMQKRAMEQATEMRSMWVENLGGGKWDSAKMIGFPASVAA